MQKGIALMHGIYPYAAAEDVEVTDHTVPCEVGAANMWRSGRKGGKASRSDNSI